MDHKRGKVTQIDITVLAPDQPIISGNAEEGTAGTVRQFIEQVTQRTLCRETRKLGQSIFGKRSPSSPLQEDALGKSSAEDTPVPIKIHTSEATYHRSHIYILLVAHTSSGFRIGHDIICSDRLPRPKYKGKQKHQPAHDPRRGSQNDLAFSAAADLVHRCVEGFIREISNESPNTQPDQKIPSTAKRACLDAHMRDQVVVFEALGKACHPGEYETETETLEDERDWTLHTKTAQWVCQQMLDI
jgi:RNA 3'-terminal phosphate cyclase (ATP)